MRSESIFVLKGFEGIDAVGQDEVGVPVQAVVAIVRLTHIPTIRLPIIQVAVIWT